MPALAGRFHSGPENYGRTVVLPVVPRTDGDGDKWIIM